MGKYVAALCVGNKVVVGINHGDAFSKLSNNEQNGEIQSGFLDPQTGKFFTEEYNFYLKQIYVVRHGEATGQDFHDSLTDLGIQQCLACADFLARNHVHGFEIYCSPYNRCIQTAQIISQITSLPCHVLDSLQKKQKNETNQHFVERVDESLANISERSILISHADFILQFVAEAVGPEFCVEFQNGIPNCSVTLIDARRLTRITVE